MAQIQCPSCGSPNVEQIDTNKYQCPYCGKTFFTQQAVTPPPSQQPYININQNFTPAVNDNPGCLMNGLCFCIPLLGIILYFVKKDELPNCAKSYLTWSLVSIGIGIFLNIIAAMA